MVFLNNTNAFHLNVGFISTRIAGTDGVTIETMKWANVLENMGCTCFYFAGELDTPKDRSFPVPKASFKHPLVRDVFEGCFHATRRNRAITRQIHELKKELKDQIHEFIDRFDIDLLIPENSLAIPLNIPLGIAITEVIAETGIKTVAHHHDFFWERDRFLKNAAWDYLNMSFPPRFPSIHHVVINSSADNQLGLRTGISATTIPNVMDFDNPAPGIDDYSADVRQALGIEPDELLILQPTRIIPRKGIEHAIELVKHLGIKAKLVISHASGDEGYEYEKRVRSYSKQMGVNTLFVSNIINEYRGRTPEGKKIYSLWDVYPHADLVTYPSVFEGFGNAFLEAIYFRKPIVINAYSIYTLDIEPKGFKVIALNGFVTEKNVEQAREILQDSSLQNQIVEHNYQLGKRYYSYRTLEGKLLSVLMELFGR